jgi:Cu/Ag efflux protein CusF
MTSKVRDAKNLEGVKVGDKVQVTFTRALAVNVEPATK